MKKEHLKRSTSLAHMKFMAASDMVYDTKNAERIARKECRACFYNVKVSGQAFTDFFCDVCHQHQKHPNTNVNKICMECAEVHSLCAHCGGDINMNVERTTYPCSLEVADYIVCVGNEQSYECFSPEEVWWRINQQRFGSIYSVSSPTGKSVDQFVPF